MASIVERVTPSITSMIRMDHTHVLAAFHRYKTGAAPEKKRAVAEQICLALEIHTQLEEDIFYPALKAVLTGDEVLDKSAGEHDQMREYIKQLRGDSDGSTFDDHVYALMHIVLHHVADEETRLLPAAERLLTGRLAELGAQMTRERLQLLRPRAGKMALTGARTFPGATGAVLAIGGSVAIGALLLSRRGNGSSRRLLG